MKRLLGLLSRWVNLHFRGQRNNGYLVRVDVDLGGFGWLHIGARLTMCCGVELWQFSDELFA